MQWVAHFNTSPNVVLVHGEADALDVLADKLWHEHQIASEIPMKGQCIAF